MPQTIFSGQDYINYLLADSVGLLHFNDGKTGHASIVSNMGLYVSIHCHIYYWANDTRRICSRAKKTKEKPKMIRHSKRVQRKDQGDNYKLVEGSVYRAWTGFDNF